MKRFALTLSLACFLLAGVDALAQAAPPEASAASQAETPDDPQGISEDIALDPGVADRAIIDRLTVIYETSGWFEALEISAVDGVVILDGQADHQDARDWATQVAEATEGVSVVINRLDISVPPSIDAYSVQESLAELWRGFYRLLPLIGIGLLVLILSAVAARFLSRWLALPIARLTDSRLLVSISQKLLVVFIILVGLIFFLRLSGLTGIAVTIASGTGVLGLIIGFAFRDIAENFLASVLISIQTPFQLGDVIEVEGHTGVVHKVTARGTVLVDFNGNHIQIANATIYKSTLKNYTANRKRRLTFVIGIGYDASVTAAQDVAMGVLREHPAVLDDPEPLVLVDQLGAATISLKVYYWIDGIEHSMLKVQSAMMRRVLRAVERAGISLPDEAREIIFPNGVQVAMQEPQGDRGDRGETSAAMGSAEPSLQEKEEKKRETVVADLADDATRSEGDLSSEVAEIQTQAAESREVEGGNDILEEL